MKFVFTVAAEELHDRRENETMVECKLVGKCQSIWTRTFPIAVLSTVNLTGTSQ